MSATDVCLTVSRQIICLQGGGHGRGQKLPPFPLGARSLLPCDLKATIPPMQGTVLAENRVLSRPSSLLGASDLSPEPCLGDDGACVQSLFPDVAQTLIWPRGAASWQGLGRFPLGTVWQV